MRKTFLKSGTFQRPGPIGRGIRVVLGCALLYLFLLTLSKYTIYVSAAIPRHPLMWFGVAASIYFLADVINVGFTRSWGRWPQLVFAFMALASAGFSLRQYQTPWGPPLGFLIFILLAYVTGHLGFSFILAGVLATPG